MGGIGKMQLAVEFTYRYARFFRGVHWLNLSAPSQFEVTIWMNTLGLVLPFLGEHAAAKAAHERALKIDEAIYSSDHPMPAGDINNLGGVCHATGDPTGAMTAFKRALMILEKLLPPEHPNIGILQENLDALNQS